MSDANGENMDSRRDMPKIMTKESERMKLWDSISALKDVRSDANEKTLNLGKALRRGDVPEAVKSKASKNDSICFMPNGKGNASTRARNCNNEGKPGVFLVILGNKKKHLFEHLDWDFVGFPMSTKMKRVDLTYLEENMEGLLGETWTKRRAMETSNTV